MTPADGTARGGEPSAPEVEGGEIHPPEPVVASSNQTVANRIIGWATDMGTPTTLLLLRHGETPGSVAKLFSGRGGEDHGLTELGERQAELAAAAVATRGDVAAIVCSPLRRCRQTAAHAAAALGLPVEVDDDLAECAFGEWDGLTYEQVQRRWPTELVDWLGMTGVAPPGGESLEEVDERVRRARDRVIAHHTGRLVLVVAHVNPIKGLVRMALDAPPHAVYRMSMSPASFSEIDYYADGTAVLRGFGGSAHLTGALSARGR